MPNCALIEALGTEIPPFGGVIDEGRLISGIRDVEHRVGVEVSQVPVEQDGVVRSRAESHEVRPERLTVDIHVADEWIIPPAAGAGVAEGEAEPVAEQEVKARAAWETIRDLVGRRDQTFRVTTPWGVYEEMLVEEAIGKEVGRGGAKITLRLRNRVSTVARDAEITPATSAGPAKERPAATQRGLVRPEEPAETPAEPEEAEATRQPPQEAGGSTDRTLIERAAEAVAEVVPVAPAQLRQEFDTLAHGARVRLRTWWQASSQAWFAGIEFPPGQVLHAARRIGRDAGIFPDIPGLGVRFVARALSADETGEPGAEAWGRTHELRAEPVAAAAE